jgi:hypothetical protein
MYCLFSIIVLYFYKYEKYCGYALKFWNTSLADKALLYTLTTGIDPLKKPKADPLPPLAPILNGSECTFPMAPDRAALYTSIPLTYNL